MSKRTDFHFLQDSQGNQSSKRLFGSAMLGIAIFLSIILFSYSFFAIVADKETTLRIIEVLTLGGVGLLSAGVVEKFGK